MVLVRGNDPYTGVEIAEQTVDWKTPATTGFYGVPFVAETMTLTRDTLAVPKEMGTTGYREFVEYGRSFVEGTLTVLARYDARWFQVLLAHAFYSELAPATGTWLDGTAITAGGSYVAGNTHIYMFSSTLPKGLTIRVHKGGQSLGKYDEFAGCMISQFTLEQAENDVMKFTFTFKGYSLTTNAQSQTPLSILGVTPVRIRDFGNTYGYCKTGATPTALNFRSFRINVDRHLDFDAAFLNNLDDIQQPGVQEIRDTTVEFTAFLEQDYGAANRPHTEYLAKASSTADIILCADVANVANRMGNSGGVYRPYGIRLEFPKVYWTRVPDSVGSGGANDTTYAFTAAKGSFDPTLGLPDSLTGDFRALAAVKNTDEPSVNAKFSTL